MRIRHALLPALLAVAFGLPTAAHAQQVRVGGGSTSDESRIVPRMTLQQAQHGIVTRDGKVALLLSREGVVLQLTDQGLEQVAAPADRSREQGMLAELISSVVHGSVRTLLNRGIEVPYSDLSEARYEDGRLFFVRTNGERVFEDVRVNDTAVMEGFHPRDARAFVARFREVRAQQVR
jgi:hypothetical protein